MAEDYDLVVIGAGSGGTRAARIAAQHGARVMIAEEFRFGGTCVVRGCVPKKLMVYASRFADAFQEAGGFGWQVPSARFDWRAFVARKEAEISRLSGLYVENLKKAGVEIVASRATVADARHVRLADGRIVGTKTILVATGGRPVLPQSMPGAELAISSNEIFDLPAFPQRLLVVGGGYIGVEFASIFVRLGAKVTLVNRVNTILRVFDEDMQKGVLEALTHRGIDFKLGRMLKSIEETADGLKVTLNDGTTVGCDQVLVATGRAPNTKGLGLAEAGVTLAPNGAVRVDQHSQTNVPSIYAVGDVTDRVALTPVAIREGQSFADRTFGGKPAIVDYANIPTAVFTTPEIGTVGLTEAEAKQTHPCVDVFAASFTPMKATLSGRDEKTIMKIIVDANTDLVLGVHILGEDAGELAQVLGIAVKTGVTKADFDATMALHPTSAEELVTMRTRRVRHEMTGEPTGPGMADAC